MLKSGAYQNFTLFCYYYDYEFFSRRSFLKEVMGVFQWVFDEYMEGRPRRAGASLPPRAGKSYVTSLFCAWWLGRLPKLSVMRNTCTARLYDKFSYDVRNIVKSERFKAIFPEVELAPDKQNLDGWNLKTSKQVGYFGAGVGGTIIGFGANIAITDDLYPDMERALSVAWNDKVHSWKESAHDSRKELACPEIFIGTRWTPTDVIGAAQEAGKIDRQIRIPALTEEGYSFCEAVKSTEEYLEIQADIDSSIWDAEYMQDPKEAKGKLFPLEELHFYDPAQLDFSDPVCRQEVEFVHVQIDPADEGGDFYAAPVMCLIGSDIYVPDVLFNTSGVEINRPDTVALCRQWHAEQANFEGNGGWQSMGKQIRADLEEVLADCSYRIFNSTTNKETRILAQAGFIKRRIFFRSDWKDCGRQYRDFVTNLTSYLRTGGNKNDDAPDVLAGGAKFFVDTFPHLF
jgi:hypothetical protein